MALDVGAEEKTMKQLQRILEKTGTVRREVKNYRQSKQGKGEFYAEETERNSDERANHRSERAYSAAADFPFAYFRILDMRGIKNISAHPI